MTEFCRITAYYDICLYFVLMSSEQSSRSDAELSIFPVGYSWVFETAAASLENQWGL